jgi:radical SAM-linked protein
MRVRITFNKTPDMRYTSHLDLHRALERSFRRARLPLAYSQGFNPQPKIHLAAALPLGFTSEAEVADIWLEQEQTVSGVEEDLRKALPPGLVLLSAKEVNPKDAALQTRVLAAEYEITLLEETPDLEMRIKNLISSSSLIRERRGREYDLRKLIEKLEILPDVQGKGQPGLALRLTSQPGATGRPEEVLAALEIPPEKARIHRTSILLADS